jgi:hypothetical protein
MDERERPTTNQPLNAERRPRLSPLLAVIGLLVVIAVIFLVITYLQQHT